jgi:hypothetical protein
MNLVYYLNRGDIIPFLEEDLIDGLAQGFVSLEERVVVSDGYEQRSLTIKNLFNGRTSFKNTHKKV